MTSFGSELFATVPKKDYLSVWEHDQPDYQKVTDFLEFKNEDTAKAAGVSLSSVRYDNRMSTDLRERIREWAILLNLVAEHFQGDKRKTALWFTTPNPLLGNVAPREMIRFGRFRKLFKFVTDALVQNRR